MPEGETGINSYQFSALGRKYRASPIMARIGSSTVRTVTTTEETPVTFASASVTSATGIMVAVTSSPTPMPTILFTISID